MRIIGLLEAARLPYMIVGAYAVFVHGEPRFSHDIDVALCLPPTERDNVRAALAGSELQSFFWAEDPLWGKRFRCFTKEGILVELFMAGNSELQRKEFERRVRLPLDGKPAWFLSAEDLIMRKLVNTRIRKGVDFDDVVGIIRVQGDKLDRAYLRSRCAVHRVCGVLDLAEAAARPQPSG